MAFTQTPSAHASCYRPLMFRFTTATSAAVEKLLVDVDIYGTTYSFRKDWYNRTGTTASYTYYFEFDVQGVLQSYLGPSPNQLSSPFDDLTGFAAVANTDLFAPYAVTVYPEIRNSNNFLETSTAGTTSSGFNAYSIIRANEDAMSLDEFIYNGVDNVKMLTNAPTALDIGYTESAFMSWITYGINAIKVTVWNGGSSAGDVIDVSAGSGLYYMGSHGIGPRQLAGQTSAIPSDFSGYDYYTIQLLTGVGTPPSETRRFNLVGRCAHAVRFHWLNRLGGVDSYTFEGDIETVAEVKSELRERQLKWNITGTTKHFPYYKGPFKSDIQSRRYLIIREPVDPDVGFWLREMLSSPEIYMESNDTYVNVVVADVNQVLSKSSQYNNDFEVKILIEDEFVQRF